ncbi:AbrB/MazE/SpoVT family DNA-binding domain-containing protein [Aetokthonos hydrillicola Thurmond2011]|jgi:bifunctional DNA-binding transcriptional regulator/antitoxin component of YhaV-PrlF toxin-antitoxin module|uniref:AbrB/MazE/SpoVT family DNA-binding domain-containing protein n=1 Tax=Aetokthonos hydrillicola Thurmond2011 TaxID=2712845 RepID=A0AAP5MD79_9CYAN|nr:AbrB/MazE/SpoVT family DNA-binding domain-containing protein [Aetokthonos hydrillicola]MBO3457201.1 AbrB/MazE/SpoVT family DNA-binding domain-containing protein [Aetokthonos hydrillicola CCALA 1050]MBW4587552.1 AbrB/MazE/SpoVT family DNA-binding domain-containing protein [Aetokthonos hydrillicola CCALA 1050]MDR9900182.1 AbrB/MazE/SpoVT family DNA-binding domain-containing protein [Aetokthonos hydrillicola Thurmond2011]
MRITPDAQITIPPEIREALSISRDVELAFEIEGDRLYLKKIQPADQISTWINTMRGCATRNLSTDQIMTLTRSDDSQ